MKYVVTLGVVGCPPHIPEGVSYGVDREEMLVAAYERAYTRDTGKPAPRVSLDVWRDPMHPFWKPERTTP